MAERTLHVRRRPRSPAEKIGSAHVGLCPRQTRMTFRRRSSTSGNAAHWNCVVTDQWIGLELRHLTALQAIAETGSFKGAAARLGYTPSAISQQIAGLERIVGTRVIAREHGRRALGPTQAGRSLLGHMAAIEARLGAAKADIDAFARGAVGSLRIGAFESIQRRLLPEVMRRFRHVFPDVELEVAETLGDFDLLELTRARHARSRFCRLALAGWSVPRDGRSRRSVGSRHGGGQRLHRALSSHPSRDRRATARLLALALADRSCAGQLPSRRARTEHRPPV